MEKIRPDLSEVPATLLVPLWARAEEQKRADPLVRDPKSAEILRALDFDFGRFRGGWMSQLGCCVRTAILDREVQAFLSDRPGAPVVNLGCGLDARELRMTGYGMWYDLDLPEVIGLRERFFPETERVRRIACSVLDFGWMDRIAAEGPVLIVAEGLFMYLSGEEVEALLRALGRRFAEAVLLVEMLAPLLVGRNGMHDTVKEAAFRWSLRDSRDFERMADRLRFDREWSYFDEARRRWRYLRLFRRIPWFRRNLNNRIVRLRFG